MQRERGTKGKVGEGGWMERLRAHATIALSARNEKKGGGSRKAIPASPHSRRDWRERGESGRKDTPFTKAALSFRSVN